MGTQERSANGSSPRTRGTRRICKVMHDPIRFIPANAGNTGSISIAQRPEGGSSPRTRGTRAASAQETEEWRFIPANAGNTDRFCRRALPLSVHPRERGEHLFPPLLQRDRDGSSPRTRGTRGKATNGLESGRFIPANAGNTYQPDKGKSMPTVHPRERGEHPRYMYIPFRYPGSSPRTRGTRSATRSVVACVAVHPRERGEHCRTWR